MRSLAAQGVIGLSVCLGGYAAVVMPLRERLGAARAQVAEAEARTAEVRAIEASMASVMERRARTERQIADLAAAGAMARSQEAVYTEVNARAADFGLQIDEFSPVDRGREAPGQERSGLLPGDAILRCRFAATGTFGELALLLCAVSEESGFVSIRSVRLSPAGDTEQPLVHAEVETEHYAVEPAPQPAAPTGGQP
jgi:hypothetical protein